jgi:GMP synthase-like glutamine amidotransferase
MGVHDEHGYPWLRQEKRLIAEAIDRGKSVLGVCLGAQLIADCLDAEVRPNVHKEIGFWPVKWTQEAQELPFLIGSEPEIPVFQWHGDTFAIPRGAVPLAASTLCENQGFLFENRVMGLQFHLESTPASVEQLLTHCAHELEPRTGIQSAFEIREGCSKLSDSNALMESILDEMARHAT